MRILLMLTLLTGCANIQDNTTLGDKIIIGTAVAVMLYGGTHIEDW
jgi:hypothetical protein